MQTQPKKLLFQKKKKVIKMAPEGPGKQNGNLM
jgi:hypothetical protein